MAEVIRMPRMSDTMEEGNIIEWLKEEGDQVEPGETLAEVETDKATMELDSFVEGTLLHIEVKEGPVPINGVIAVVGEEGEDWKKVLEEAQQENGEEEEKEEAAKAEDEKAEEQKAEEKEESKGEPAGEGKRIIASPLARSMAKEKGIDLAKIEGSGDGGRIVKRDIEEYTEKEKTAPVPGRAPAPERAPQPEEKKEKEKPTVPVTPFVLRAGEENYEEVNISQMRKTIARRLAESKFSAPHFYLTMEIDMGMAMKWRKQMNEVAPNKISFNDLIVKAAAIALRHHPDVNASWQGDTIRKNKDVNIGVAVAIDEGLLVPVIRHTDMKSLSQINYEIRQLADKAKRRKLSTEEMQGNTFTVSNLGMFGIEEFTAIINPPDSCILAVGGIIEKPVIENGEITAGHRMKVTLSCDHRVVDGAMGARFLQTLKEILENPIRIMV
jgi:pyruvate dehydrogenase E2 component (dihydrolipoamide acetyltransferase)